MFFKKLIFILLKLSSLLLLLIILKYSLLAKVKEEIIDNITLFLKNKDINILEIKAIVYYKLTRDKNNKLFSSIIAKINKTYFTSIASRNSYILVNKLYFYKSKIKYKKCCESNTYIINNNKFNISVNSKASYTIRINSAKTLIRNEILVKLLIEYYNYIDVFDRIKTNKLLSYYLYNYKLEFINNYNKIELSKS